MKSLGSEVLNIKRSASVSFHVYCFTSVIPVLSSLYQKSNKMFSGDQQYQASQDPEKSVAHYCIYMYIPSACFAQ